MADLDPEWELESLADSLTFPRPLLIAFRGREPKATTDYKNLRLRMINGIKPGKSQTENIYKGQTRFFSTIKFSL